MKTGTRALLEDASRRSIAYLKSLEKARAFPNAKSLATLSKFAEPLPERSADPRKVLAMLDKLASPATVASAGGRYFGFVTGGALPVTVAANWLACAWDQCAGLEVLSPAAAAIEDVTERWLVELLSLPKGTAAGFVTGATAANFTALAAARHAVLARAGWDVEANGLFGAPTITVIVGEEVHVSVLKALAMLGLGRNRIVKVPADNQGRMRADALPGINGPTIVCIQAGNVNSGAFDPAEEICQKARAAGAWVHVDGAFGLWAAAVPSLADLTRGLSEADSWGTDTHKWLNVPYDSGIAFIRERKHLKAAMNVSAAYLERGEKREPNQYTPEMSRRARGVEIWAALRMLGRAGLIELFERNCRQARRFAEGLRAAGYEILNDVALNQALVSFGSDEQTRRVIEAIQDEGTCWCGGTVWQGRAAMRISVSSWATTDEDVERSLKAMLQVAARELKRR
ncbi:MAG TPA: aminotransferase class V-fold PLP-dependent enzyme [Candidatus Acidoferrales bacterium]|nr:aminotransferase class V-fold PLP-dependent enzyme [Candidatus Acidoferrales bacterium]